MKKNIVTSCVCLIAFLAKGQTPAAVWTQAAHSASLSVNGVAFSNDGQNIVSGTDCAPSSIRKYNTSNGTVTWDYTVGSSFMCIMGVGFSANGNYIAAVEEMGNVLIFSNTTPTPALTTTLAMGTMYAFSIDFSPNNHKVAVGGSEGKLQTYVASSGSLNINVNAHASWVTTVRFSPDNTKIATGGSDNLVKIWDTTGVLLHNLISHTEDITSVRFSQNNNLILTTSTDDKVKIWSVATGSLIQTISPSAYDVLGVDVSADDNHFAIVSADKMIRVYNLNTYVLEATFGLTTQGIPRCIAWSKSDQSKIVVGYSNGTISLYDTGGTVDLKTNDSVSKQISISPNPCFEHCTVDFGANAFTSYSLFDVSGKFLFSKTIEQGTRSINLNSELLNGRGVYLIQLTSKDNNSIIKKIIKN